MNKSIILGSVTLRQVSGKVLASHPKLAQPYAVDAKALERWILRQLREMVQ